MKYSSPSLAIFLTTTALSGNVYGAEKTGQRTANEGADAVPPLLIVPAYMATKEFSSSSGTFCVPQRVQQVYKAAEFGTKPILITGFYWRPNPKSGFAFRTTVPDLLVKLSTTSKQADELSSVFSENAGPDETVVFSGSLKLSSRFNNGAGGTKKFDMVLKLQHPFLYDPGQGNLLLDIRNPRGSAAAMTDAYGTETDGCSRAIALDPDAFSASFKDTAVDPIQIIFKRVRTKKKLVEPVFNESAKNSGAAVLHAVTYSPKQSK